LFVGVLEVGLRIRESHSLKDKRRVVKSIKDRVRARLNVSIAEVGDADLWQRADLAAVTVSNDRGHAESVLKEVLKIIDTARGGERFETRVQFL
jgi:uncharacterized protein YlxP (DUF503 family)